MPAKTLPVISAGSSAPSKAGKKSKKGKDKAIAPQFEANCTLETPWSWTCLADSAICKHPAVFTKDSRYFFLIVSSSVKIYSAATGLVVSTLTASTIPSAASTSSRGDEHTNDITTIILHPHNQFQIFTASLDGCVRLWDFLDAILLKTIDIGMPITHLCAHLNFKDHLFVACSMPAKKRENQSTQNEQSVIFRVALKTTNATAGLALQKTSELLRIGKMRPAAGLVFSPSGAWLVAIGGPKSYVANTSDLKTGFTKFVSTDRLTCLAFHPFEEYFATGDDKGQIRLWFCLNGQISFEKLGAEKRAQTTTLHWHAHAVKSVTFTPNGAYLLSGGEEAVLVIWQLQSGKKEFVPRIGAPIISLAISNSTNREQEYLLGLVDGSLVFVAASNLKISRSLSRIKINPSTKTALFSPIPLAIHPQAAYLILPSSHPSSLQIYSPSTSTIVSELEVAPSNRVSRRDDKALIPSCVERAVISHDGQWMATIDSRDGNEDGFGKNIHLKIWRCDAGAWSLNTRIDRPHGTSNINSLSFNPTSTDISSWLLVTTGEDNNVKTWKPQPLVEKDGGVEVCWGIRSTFGYRAHTPLGAAWSPDGSILAVAHGPCITLWDSVSNALHTTLTCPEIRHVCNVSFIGRAGRYIVVTGRRAIAVWDLILNSVLWHSSFETSISHIMANPKTDSFAILLTSGTKSRVLIFNPMSPTPARIHNLPFHLLCLVWSPFPSLSTGEESDSYSLIGITSQWAVVLVGDDIRVPEEEGSVEQSHNVTRGERKTLFQDIFGDSALVDWSPPPKVPVPPPESGIGVGRFKLGKGLLDGPAYLLPSMETLFSPLVECLMETRPPPELPTADDLVDDQAIDEDTIMTAPNSVPLVAEHVVDEKEIEMFVGLFEEHLFSVAHISTTTTPSHSGVNGNGIHANGRASHTAVSSPTVSTFKIDPAKGRRPAAVVSKPLIQVPRPASPPAKAGKKRKKPSLG